MIDIITFLPSHNRQVSIISIFLSKNGNREVQSTYQTLFSIVTDKAQNIKKISAFSTHFLKFYLADRYTKIIRKIVFIMDL